MSKNMATRGGRGYFAFYGYSENLKNLLLQKCPADFQIIFVEMFLAWPSIRFLQAKLIGRKLWLPGGGALIAKVKKKNQVNDSRAIMALLYFFYS